jgi:tetratricopeptide (TPR) repeat protein
LAAADRAYGGALAAAPADWPRAPEVLVKQISARRKSGDTQGCIELAMTSAHLTARGGSASATDFALTAVHCAEANDDPRSRLLSLRLNDAVRQAMNAPDSAMSTDDRSDALLLLRELAIRLGDPDRARQLARQQRELLDQAAAKATTAYGRMTHIWPRVEVYGYLGETAELVPDLEKMVAELPTEYDPPARLAGVYLELGRMDDALAMAERARGLAYGPRKARVLILIGDIHAARGDRVAEKKAREEVVAHHEALPAGHRNPEALAAARAALAELGNK